VLGEWTRTIDASSGLTATAINYLNIIDEKWFVC
jgi:hypothetical protein